MASGGHEASVGAQDLELARALVPVLLERIERSARRLERIDARLGTPQEPVDPTEALGAEAGEVESLGWLLGWIAGGLGTELLLERHEPRALGLGLALVRAALQRDGVALAAIEVPAVRRAGGWRLAWAVAGLAWRAARADGGDGTLELRSGTTGQDACLAAYGPAPAALRERSRVLERELPGTYLVERHDGWRWCFPASWLEEMA